MKALTLTQPYASLIAVGAKRIETRSWTTRYRGPLAIHAAKGVGPVGGERGLLELCQSEPFAGVLAHHPPLPRGVIVATCILMDCREIDYNPVHGVCYYQYVRGVRCFNFVDDQERAFGNYSPGRYAWLLADVQPLNPPIPAMGRQGLWEWTESEVADT